MAEPRGPVFLTEPADNVGGGAPGDGTTLLAAMIEAGAQGTVVMWDPLAAALATSAGVGQRFSGKIGGRTLSLHGPPVAIAGRVAFAGNVAYQRDAAYMTGQHVDLGLAPRWRWKVSGCADQRAGDAVRHAAPSMRWHRARAGTNHQFEMRQQLARSVRHHGGRAVLCRYAWHLLFQYRACAPYQVARRVFSARLIMRHSAAAASRDAR